MERVNERQKSSLERNPKRKTNKSSLQHTHTLNPQTSMPKMGLYYPLSPNYIAVSKAQLRTRWLKPKNVEITHLPAQ